MESPGDTSRAVTVVVSPGGRGVRNESHYGQRLGSFLCTVIRQTTRNPLLRSSTLLLLAQIGGPSGKQLARWDFACGPETLQSVPGAKPASLCERRLLTGRSQIWETRLPRWRTSLLSPFQVSPFPFPNASPQPFLSSLLIAISAQIVEQVLPFDCLF